MFFSRPMEIPVLTTEDNASTAVGNYDGELVNGSDAEIENELDHNPKTQVNNNVVVVDGSLSYANLAEQAKPKEIEDQVGDDDSLLTTESHACIDSFDMNTTIRSGTRQDQVDAVLSFQASQMDACIESFDLNTTIQSRIRQEMADALLSFHASQMDSIELQDAHLVMDNSKIVAPDTKEGQRERKDQPLTVEMDSEQEEHKDQELPVEGSKDATQNKTSWWKILSLVALFALVSIIGITVPPIPFDGVNDEIKANSMKIGTVLSAAMEKKTIAYSGWQSFLWKSDNPELATKMDFEINSVVEEQVSMFVVSAMNETMDNNAEESPKTYVNELFRFLENHTIKPKFLLETFHKSQSQIAEVVRTWFRIVFLVALGVFSSIFLASNALTREDQRASQQERKAEKVEQVKEIIKEEEWDVSHYESLKVHQIRELLRSRKCKTIGKKPVLIRRLAAVYQAELQTLTVRQLRPILRSKGCKQDGRKEQLIKQLVESGM